MNKNITSAKGRRRGWVVLGIAAATLIVGLGAIISIVPISSDAARTRVIASLSRALDDGDPTMLQGTVRICEIASRDPRNAVSQTRGLSRTSSSARTHRLNFSR